MSSFVVEKAAYMRAAGLLAGIQDIKRKSIVFDYKKYKWVEGADWIDIMAYFYQLNVISVQEQYKDHDMEGTPPTDKECRKIFNEYRKKGKCVMLNTPKDLIMDLRDFFACCEYQTEKLAYFFEMHQFFDRVLVALMPYLHQANQDAWTDLIY